MRVVIFGAGEVGYHIVGTLYREGVDIAVVDNDPAILERLRQEFNITAILGNAIDTSVQEQAQLDKADLFLAVTNYDETNIISCMIAAEAGVPTKIARIKTIDFAQQASFSEKKNLGIDLVINPYEVAAEHLARLIRTPNVTDYNHFLSEQLLLVRLSIDSDNPLAGSSVLDFGRSSQIPAVLIALIQRKGHSFIPPADEIIRGGDFVYFFIDRDHLNDLFLHLKLPIHPPKRIFINGGGHIGYALARRLEAARLDVRILEISKQRCDELSEQLERSLVLNVDGTDARAMKAENVDRADYFISLTYADQINTVSCLMAKELGAKKTVALVKQPELISTLMNRTNIDIAFSPRLLTARKILRFVRGQNLDSFFTIPNSDIELLELRIKPGMKCLDGSIASYNLPEGVLIGAVRRDDAIFVPRGMDCLRGGDTIMLLQQRRNRRFTRAFFLEPGKSAGTPVPLPAAKADG